MQKGYYTNSGVCCPYYRRQNNVEIVCSGVMENGSLHIDFESPEDRRLYQIDYCGFRSRSSTGSGKPEACPVFQMLEEFYGD